jgi:hypothetical protein
VLAEVSGEVLEIGFGTGLNLTHCTKHARRITTVDPNSVWNKLAWRRIAWSGIAVVDSGTRRVVRRSCARFFSLISTASTVKSTSPTRILSSSPLRAPVRAAVFTSG